MIKKENKRKWIRPELVPLKRTAFLAGRKKENYVRSKAL